ncbi:hypothetical protein Hanom_Chr12g01139221 [Helianthus anomalus]
MIRTILVLSHTWKNKDHSPLSTYQNTKTRTGDCSSILFFIALVGSPYDLNESYQWRNQ